MRKYCIFISLLLIMSVLLTGCTHPAYFRRNVQFTPVNWARIAVLRFSGDARFTQVATDTFNLHLLKQNDFIILEPSITEVAMSKMAVEVDTSGSLTVLQAQKIGQLVNAEAVFLGNITSHFDGFTLDAFATVKLIDTKSGEIIAISHKPSGLLLAWNEHQCVVHAVNKVAKDMLKALKDLASKNKISSSSGEIQHPFEKKEKKSKL